MVSVAKRSVFNEGEKMHLSVGIRLSIYNAVNNYVALVKWWL